MNDKIKNILTLILLAGFIFTFSVWSIAKPADSVSESERRSLAKFPEMKISNVIDGKFMTDFEKYSTDQFPLRDAFRSVKAYFTYNVWHKSDNNGIYFYNEYASKIEYPMDEKSVVRAVEKIVKLCSKYLDETNNVYLTVVPDKNYFMAEKSGHPSIDYEKFTKALCDKTKQMNYIDIFDLLELEDYYKTDTHWRQERIIDVAEKITNEMGAKVETKYEKVKLDKGFCGVYAGQSALPLEKEELFYLKNKTIDSFEVTDHETDKTISVYDMEKANGNDPYEIFLSGSKSLLTVKNPNAKNSKRLIVFRDSFGSSVAPLLATAYSETVIVDIRYISSEILGKMIDFKNSDVLFLYSTLVLNNSITLK